MTRVTRRMLTWPAVLAGVVILFLVEERVRGMLALRQWQREMRARGEKLGVAELTPPLPTNPAVQIITASEAQTLLGAAVAPQNFPSPMLAVAPGKARVISAAAHWLDHDGRSNSWVSLTSTLDYTRGQLPELRAALTNRSFFIKLDYDQGFDLMLPHLAKFKGAVQALNTDAVYALHAGRLDEAYENLVAATYVLELAKDEGLMISQLVRIACGAILTSGLWEALQADGWSEAQLAALQARWEQQEFVAPLVHCLAMERAFGARVFDGSRYSLRQLAAMTGGDGLFGGGSGEPPKGELAELLGPLFEATNGARQLAGLFLWRMAWAQQDQLSHHREMQRVIETGRRTAVDRHWEAPPSADEDDTLGISRHRRLDGPHSAYDRARYWLSLTLLPPSDKAYAKAVRLEVTRELGVAALALKRYQLKHGRLPPTLDALVPDFVRTVPRDWYAGKPLRYRPNPDGTFVLYSIGENGVDDQGDSRDAKGETRGMQNGAVLDIVWPQRATPDEVAAAELAGKPAKSKGRK